MGTGMEQAVNTKSVRPNKAMLTDGWARAARPPAADCQIVGRTEENKLYA